MIIVKQQGKFRIAQHEDSSSLLGDLAGDCFDPLVNTDIDPERLKKEFNEFRTRFENFGAVGYILEKWNPMVDAGWQHVDSIWGIMGDEDLAKNEYITEFIDTIIYELKIVDQQVLKDLRNV